MGKEVGGLSITIFSWAVGIYAVLIVFIFGRLIAGPTIPDRAVALDTMNSLVVAIMIVLAAFYDSVVMEDIAIVYAALSFVSTMFIARYIEGGM